MGRSHPGQGPCSHPHPRGGSFPCAGERARPACSQQMQGPRAEVIKCTRREAWRWPRHSDFLARPPAFSWGPPLPADVRWAGAFLPDVCRRWDSPHSHLPCLPRPAGRLPAVSRNPSLSSFLTRALFSLGCGAAPPPLTTRPGSRSGHFFATHTPGSPLGVTGRLFCWPRAALQLFAGPAFLL